MIDSYNEFEDYVRQFDDELTDEGVEEFSGLVLGSGALAYHMEQNGRNVDFDIKDVDLFTERKAVDAVAQTPYGAATPDRRFNGGIYQLGGERNVVAEEVDNWDISSGEFSECANIDMMTVHYEPDVEWQLRADLANDDGDTIEGLENDLRVVPLSTYLTTKKHADREKDEEHREMAKLLIDDN